MAGENAGRGYNVHKYTVESSPSSSSSLSSSSRDENKGQKTQAVRKHTQ